MSLLRSRGRAAAAVVLLALGAGTLAGCAGAASRPAATAAPVAIADFRDVAGRWVGPVSGLAGPRQDEDWVQLTIGEDGTYTFAAARTIGVFGGKGQFALKDGKLVIEGERGRATFALLEGTGGRHLHADGVLASGAPVSAELTPAR